MKNGALAALVISILFFARVGISGEPQVLKGTHSLTPSLSIARSIGANEGWLPGFNFAYGNFIDSWLQPEVGFQFEWGFTENQLYAASAIGGLSFFYNRGSWVLPFGGFRFGLGALRENDSSGGAQTRMTITVAPKAGILFRISQLIGIYVHVEYQRVFVIGDERQGYEDLNLIRIPLGVAFLF